MIVAVDGPAASGKGTIARAIATRFSLPYLDTGLLYRAVGVAVVRGGNDPADVAAAVAATAFADGLLSDPALRGEAAAAAASVVAAHAEVRAALIERQRAFARRPGGAVLDGRDIGTTIAPQADVKLFIVASPEIRAERRHRELIARGECPGREAVLADILARDARDAGRVTAPLAAAHDAVVLDTSVLDVAAAVEEAIVIVSNHSG